MLCSLFDFLNGGSVFSPVSKLVKNYFKKWPLKVNDVLYFPIAFIFVSCSIPQIVILNYGWIVIPAAQSLSKFTSPKQHASF